MNVRGIPFVTRHVFIMVLALLVGGLPALTATPVARKKDKAERKGSEAVRQNPFIRDYFRERSLSMQPSLKENDRSLNTTLDYLLDDLVDRSVKLAKKLSAEDEELYSLSPEYRQRIVQPDKNGPTADRSLFEKTRVKAEAIKSTTKGLEGQLDFIVQALHLTVKVNEPETARPALDQICSDIESIHVAVGAFRKDLDEFFFPKSNTISLEGLQTTALPVQLKKIERAAERIELLTKRTR